MYPNDPNYNSYSPGHRRKRILSRQLDSAGNPLPPAPEAPIVDPVVDPTVYGERHRKHGHALLYFVTQLLVVLSFLGGGSSIVASILRQSRWGQYIAAGALAMAAVSIVLCGRTRLSGRLLGYAIAAGGCAIMAMALCYILPALHVDGMGMGEEEHGSRQYTVDSR